MAKKVITRDDLQSIEDYTAIRRLRRTEVSAIKRDRRVSVGPDATFYFESYDTMVQQIQEMLYIERGGDAQLADELAAYNPLIPNGSELVATFMIEIEDEVRRQQTLAKLGRIEGTITLDIAGESVSALPETDQERTTADGKASSVHFLHFPLSPMAIAKLKTPDARAVLAIDHPQYAHMAVMPERVRAALATDLD
jgi:hypothetical protein